MLDMTLGMVRCGEDVVYLQSPGRPSDICVQLGKACILVAGMGRGGMFLFLCFFTFPLSSLSLSHLLYCFFSPFLKDDPQVLT